MSDPVEDFPCIPKPNSEAKNLKWMTLGISIIPFIAIFYIIYYKVILKKVLSDKGRDDVATMREFSGTITKLKLIQKGITFSLITTTMVVIVYTKHYSGFDYCVQDETQFPLHELGVNIVIWIVGLFCYFYIWYMDIKKKFSRLKKEEAGEGTLRERIFTLIIMQLINIGIATAFIADISIMENGEDIYCLCSKYGVLESLLLSLWILTLPFMFMKLGCNIIRKKCKCCKRCKCCIKCCDYIWDLGM
eukprot:473308_1